MKTFKTKAGTELPLLNLKGKDYLQVQHRLVWFREEKPAWGIETEFLQLNSDIAVAKATIRDENGKIVAQGTKSETPKGFPDYIEKAESGAIGRALAMCGYGTAFAQELDEGERLADAPIPSFPAPKKTGSPDDFQFTFGKYKGLTLAQVGPHDCNNYAEFIRSQAAKEGKPVNSKVAEALEQIDAFTASREVKK